MGHAGFPQGRRIDLEGRIKRVFTPHAPINDVQLFRGRIGQIRAATDTITSPGLHAVIYGDRGVGKTSLANVLKDILGAVLGTSRVACSPGESFTSVIRRSLSTLAISEEVARPGFRNQTQQVTRSLNAMLPENGHVPPDAVAEVLSQLPPYVVLVIDEFDRLRGPSKASFADLVKALSDRGAPTTVLLVGVAEDVGELIVGHASVERSLRQILLPRMADEEIRDILEQGFPSAGFTVQSEDVYRGIIRISQGFPHYTHLLAQNGARAALDAGRNSVGPEDMGTGLEQAVQYADQSHRDLYFKAVTGTKKKNLWREVVAACALAESDERGFFSSRAVQEALSGILKRPVIQQTVAFHLGKLIEDSRGPLLQRIGPERRYRYRFINPLMGPFVLMKAIADGLVPA